MTYKLVMLPKAEADIAEAVATLAERAPIAAARCYRCVRAEIQSLAIMPGCSNLKLVRGSH